MTDAGPTAWSDRFRAPAASELLDALDGEARSLVEKARERIKSAGWVEVVEWRGEPCRWCLSYRAKGARDERRVCTIVPDPAGPFVIAGVERPLFETLTRSKLGRAVRERLAVGRVVGQRVWVEWSCDPAEGGDDLLACLEVAIDPAGAAAAATGKTKR